MKDDELREIFLTEALGQYEELNRLFTALEKDHSDRQAIEAIFRITHTLKANAAAMGFEGVASMAHVLEDIFSVIKKGSNSLTTTVFNELFRANDKLGELLQGVQTDTKVSYKGMLAKLRVILTKMESNDQEASQENSQNTDNQPSQTDSSAAHQSTPATPAAVFEPENEEHGAAYTETKLLAFTDSVQVPIAKLDALLNLVGELAIEKDRLIAVHAMHGGSSNDFARLYRVTSDLQYSVMGVRLVQVSLLFAKFHRIVRDVAMTEGKKVNLVLEGAHIEIDRNVLQIISDSMIHLVRNAVSHGIETTEERKKTGKSEAGTLTLRARNDKEMVIIEVADDGKGINPQVIRRKVIEKGMLTTEFAASLADQEVIQYIFESGFSSADQVTAISGRGVGMDVVKRATESIGGKVSLKTEVGQGTTFSLALPSSMAVKKVLLFMLGDYEFAVPLSFTEAVISLTKKDLHKVGGGLVATYLGNTIAVVYLNDIFNAASVAEVHQAKGLQQGYQTARDNEKIYLLVVSANGRQTGFVVDKLLQQKEIIEKPLSKPLDGTLFVSGATILGNGNVCLVLDVPSLIDFLFRSPGTVSGHGQIQLT